jgi:uncharacterized ion transporter superfamily protein YfcC
MMKTHDDQAELRERAEKSLKAKFEFKAHLLAFVLVNSFIVLIWAVTGSGFFWPIFPIAGWGIGLAFHARDAYGRTSPTEDEVRREMHRLSQR